MAEYIEREALKERFRKRIKWLEKDAHDQYSLGLFHGCEYDADLINEPPAADVAPVRHGRWVDNGIPDSILSGCSVCGFTCGSSSFFYCPNCGAKMDGDDGNSDMV